MFKSFVLIKMFIDLQKIGHTPNPSQEGKHSSLPF